MTRELPSIEELRKIFSADFETGKVYRILPDGSEREVKGVDNGKGYLRLYIFGKLVSKHRFIFALYHGRWPKGDVDHINGDRADNKISNLRDVSRRDNNRNMSIRKRNKSGQHGVHYNTASGKWLAKIGQRGSDTYEYLGLYTNLDDAIAVRKEAEVRHGYHPNHGRKR